MDKVPVYNNHPVHMFSVSGSNGHSASHITSKQIFDVITEKLSVLNKWHYSFDNNIDAVHTGTGFAKAFDTVSHPKLHAVLHSYSVS